MKPQPRVSNKFVTALLKEQPWALVNTAWLDGKPIVVIHVPNIAFNRNLMIRFSRSGELSTLIAKLGLRLLMVKEKPTALGKQSVASTNLAKHGSLHLGVNLEHAIPKHAPKIAELIEKLTRKDVAARRLKLRFAERNRCGPPLK